MNCGYCGMKQSYKHISLLLEFFFFHLKTFYKFENKRKSQILNSGRCGRERERERDHGLSKYFALEFDPRCSFK